MPKADETGKEKDEAQEGEAIDHKKEVRRHLEPDYTEVSALMSMVWQACCNSCPSHIHSPVHSDKACNPERCGFMWWMSHESPSTQCTIH